MNVIAFTGAGISKAAGIPTFEEVPNLKDKLTVEFKQSNPVEFFDTMETLIDTVKDKEPTLAHKALASLPIPIITMNIDCLHQKAGSRLVLELHGNYRKENIVLYGENIHNAEAVINLILQVSGKARLYNQESIFLVIGTSMQTAFANTRAKSRIYITRLCSKLVKLGNGTADNTRNTSSPACMKGTDCFPVFA